MESRIKVLIERLKNLNNDIARLYDEINEANRTGKRGRAQQLMNTRRYTWRKIQSLGQEFHALLRGTVCYVSYKYKIGNIEKIVKAILINLTDEEIRDSLILYCELNGATFIEILEIQRIPTKFG